MFIPILIIFMQFSVLAHSAEDTLVLVHVIVRHCDRTPESAELYDNYPYYDESWYAPYGYGQLTNAGNLRCYNIGKSLRQRYNGFINTSYHYTLAEGRSTYYTRTKNSLQLILSGLFPPTEELTWLQSMNWIPFGTYYDKGIEDKLLSAVGTTQFITEFKKFVESEESKQFCAPFEEMMKNISKLINEPVDCERIAYLTRGLELAESFNFTTPDEWKSYYPYPMQHAIVQYFALKLGTVKLRRLYSGHLFSKMINDTEMKIKQHPDFVGRKIYIYAGHDITILGFLRIFDIWYNAVVPVGSYCIFEAHKINGTYGFKLLLFNYTYSEPQPIPLPGFGEFIPLEDIKIQKREFLELDDLDESSVSTKPIESLPVTLFLMYCIMYIF